MTKVFFPGDFALCLFTDSDTWYPVAVLSEYTLDTNTSPMLMVNSNTGYILCNKPVSNLLHMHMNYDPFTNSYTNEHVALETGELVPYKEFCATHKVQEG